MAKMMRHGGRGWLFVVLWLTGFNLWGRTIPDATDPTGFFTTVADKLLRSTFSFGVTNIPVCSNGVYVYSPAVQRLLQVSANIYDAANTNFFPTVFRPCFSADTNGNIFITGYTNVVSVTGLDDPQLFYPQDAAFALRAGATNVFVNIFGVPWIIGAKKGLPNFNQLAMVDAVRVTRKLQVTRTTTNMPLDYSKYATNQMYVISITNNFGISFWNSYSNDYVSHSAEGITIHAYDRLDMYLTNGVKNYVTTGANAVYFSFTFKTNVWPGARWGSTGNQPPPNWVPNSKSFIAGNWTFPFLGESVYRFNNDSFESVASPTSPFWETTSPALPPLPQFGLVMTNRLQAVILDGSNIVDYVQLSGPTSGRNLCAELADPNYPPANGVRYQWSANSPYVTDATPSWGVLNQLNVSGNANLAPGNAWVRPPNMPSTLMDTKEAEAAFFDGFFHPSFQVYGVSYTNSETNVQAPYMPSRVIYDYSLWQANDPLVHYLASDLNCVDPGNMGLHKSDDPASAPIPTATKFAYVMGDRYQPWGRSKQMANLLGVNTNEYNLTCKDPLVWSPDYWNFPTNLLASLDRLGQVHRGTPWQTLFLKSSDVLQLYNETGYVGTNTWAQWTGDTQFGEYRDAALMAPVQDWRLADLLIALLDTNDVAQRFPVNNTNIAGWLNVCDGLTVYSNSATFLYASFKTPKFDVYTMTSNSLPAAVVAAGIAQARAGQPNGSFYSPGDVLTAPELSVASPWLNTATVNLQRFGITDVDYSKLD